MMHLTGEQFEDAMQSPGTHAEHLAACADCRQQLAGREALRLRLGKSFASITLPRELADRIGEQVRGQAISGTGVPPVSSFAYGRRELGEETHGQDAHATATHGRDAHATMRFALRWPAMAAAAAMLVAAVIVGFVIWSPQPASAAQAQLVRIHRANVSGQAGMFASSRPEQLKDYLQSQMKDSLPIVDPAKGGKLRGCCIARFNDEAAASYLVQTEQGAVSIIILNEKPEALGMKRATTPEGSAYWSAVADGCNMAAVNCPCGHMFYAVSEAPTSTLVKVLAELRANCCGK